MPDEDASLQPDEQANDEKKISTTNHLDVESISIGDMGIDGPDDTAVTAEAYYGPRRQTDEIAAPESAPEPEPVAPPVEDAPRPVYNIPNVTESGVYVKPKKSHKKLIAGILIPFAVLLFAAGSAAAYKLWYQTPDKVLSDAIINLVSAKTVKYDGEFNIKDDGYSVNVVLDGASAMQYGNINVKATVSYGNQEFKVSGAGMIDKEGDLYVKLTNVRALADKYLELIGSDTTAFDGFVKKVDDKWILVSLKDLTTEEIAKQQTCLTGVFDTFSKDKVLANEISDKYLANKFIEVKKELGSSTINGVGSFGYQLGLNNNNLKKFYSSLAGTKLASEIKKCDKDFKFDGADVDSPTNSVDKSELEVWVSRWRHEITQVKASTEDDEAKASMVFKPTFNSEVTVNTPAKPLTVSELKTEFEKAVKILNSSYYYSDDQASYDGLTLSPLDI